MAFLNSLKSGPLGTVDTRITMNEMKDSNIGIPFGPAFAPFTGLDGSDERQPERQPRSQTETGASSNRGHRPTYHRQALFGLIPGPKAARIKLDAARTGAASRRGESKFDYFQDSSEENFDPLKVECKRPGSPNLRPIPARHRVTFDLITNSWVNHSPRTDPGMSGKSDNQEPGLRSTPFPPVAIPSPQSAVVHRYLPSVDDIQGVAVSDPLDKEPLGLLSRGPKATRCTCTGSCHTPDHERDCKSSFTEKDREEQSRKVVANDSDVANDSNLANDAKRIPDFVLIALSLRRVQREPDSPLGSGSRYDLRLRVIQMYSPKGCFRNLCIAHRADVDNLLFNTYFVIPGLARLMHTTFFVFAASFLADNRAGAVLLGFGTALLRLLKKIVDCVLAKCGMSFGFQCTSEVHNLDE
ncbi:hypothetical protein N7535_004983 [Penicillium sp. DV-2018c]|nr:hypothetical protein N7461_008564 [Penicillium sp. DV-2018c]KAJ5571323.1 hypothetical protein N7535_004983 [Penicillium sp. DV-2018c]